LCLKFAHEHSCEWNSETTLAAIDNGQLICLKYAIEHGCPWPTQQAFQAIWRTSRALRCLEYAAAHPQSGLHLTMEQEKEKLPVWLAFTVVIAFAVYLVFLIFVLMQILFRE
jgi:hypothetical protein